MEHIIFTLALRLSDGIIVHNNYAKEFVINVYKPHLDRIFVIPHGNYLEYFPDSNITREEAKKTLGILPNKIVFIFFGNIRPYKGINLLLASFGQGQSKEIQNYFF